MLFFILGTKDDRWHWSTIWHEDGQPADLRAFTAHVRGLCAEASLYFMCMWKFSPQGPVMDKCRSLNMQYEAKFRAACLGKFTVGYHRELGATDDATPEQQAFEREILAADPDAVIVFQAAEEAGAEQGLRDKTT
jgi:hypothetical protein